MQLDRQRSSTRTRTRTRSSDALSDLREARQRTLEVISDLSDEQLMGPMLPIVNPLRWEVGHLGWFQEHWLLNHFSGEPPIREDGDALYDSMKVPHDARWDLPLPTREETLAYIQRVLDRVVEEHDSGRLLSRTASDEFDGQYFLRPRAVSRVHARRGIHLHAADSWIPSTQNGNRATPAHE